jgi:hypothetical protein
MWLAVTVGLLPRPAAAQTLLPTIIELPPVSAAHNTDLKVGAGDVAGDAVVGDAVGDASGDGAPWAALTQPTADLPFGPGRTIAVQATELRGLLPHQADRHYFGLDSTKPGGAFAVTLEVEPASAMTGDAVNFVVLTQEGLTRFLAGADPLEVKAAMGSPLLFDQVGNRLTALVPGTNASGYTLIVYNNGLLPVTYTLQVQGGILRDDAGQTFSAVAVDGSIAMPQVIQEIQAVPSRLGLLPAASAPVVAESLLTLPATEPVKARRVSGMLLDDQTRHYLDLAADPGREEVVLTLRYTGETVEAGRVNFWVMTQDGVRHLIQGGNAQELNLATGLPLGGGVYQARLRMAPQVLYTVVVHHNGAPADYALSVEGGLLVDRYGQTREAQVAALEIMALSGQ